MTVLKIPTAVATHTDNPPMATGKASCLFRQPKKKIKKEAKRGATTMMAGSC
jgi:hypothetical protein